MSVNVSPRPRAIGGKFNLRGLLFWSWAHAWRFALVGPPVGGCVVLIVPLIGEGAAQPEEVMGALIMASIFAYVFALPGAVLAGVIYGALKYCTATDSRWRLGALAGGLGWVIYVLVGAALRRSVDDLSFMMLLPVGIISGALCARLLGWHTNAPTVR